MDSIEYDAVRDLNTMLWGAYSKMGRVLCSSEYSAGYGCAVSSEIHSFLAKLMKSFTSCKHDSWLGLSMMVRVGYLFMAIAEDHLQA